MEPNETVVSSEETLDEMGSDMGAGEPAEDVPTSVPAGSGTVTVEPGEVDGTTAITVEHPVFEGEKRIAVTAGDDAVGTWHFSGKDTPKTVVVEHPADGLKVQVRVGNDLIAEHG